MNNLVYFTGILAWSMIVIVYWAVENNLVHFAQKRMLICDYDSFLGCHSLVAVNNLVYLR